MSKNIDVEKLNLAKNAKGLTVKQVAELSGVPVGTASKIFSGLRK